MTTTVEDHLNYKRILNERGDYSQDEIIDAKVQKELYGHIDNEMLEIQARWKGFERDRLKSRELPKARTTKTTIIDEPLHDEYSSDQIMREPVEITYGE